MDIFTKSLANILFVACFMLKLHGDTQKLQKQLGKKKFL